jgi:hypothetical protein
MNQQRLELFLSTYADEMERAHQENPSAYCWTIKNLPEVMGKARAHIEAGTFGPNAGPVAVRTMTRLQIRPFNKTGFYQWLNPFPPVVEPGSQTTITPDQK